MPVKHTSFTYNALLKTGQTTQYSSELDDGYYQKGIAKSYTILTAGQYAGTTNVDLTHLASTAVSFDAASKEIRGTGLMGVFKAAGGETIVVSGSASNNGVFTTKATGTADKVIVNETIVNESAGASVVIKKREAMSNNAVYDNNTGLMWARYEFTKLGSAGDGKFLFTGVDYDVFAACAAANAVSLGGYSDWRVPNILECFSITDFEATTGYPDSTAWPSISTNYYWISTTRPADTTYGYGLHFQNPTAYMVAKPTWSSRLLLVRGG